MSNITDNSSFDGQVQHGWDATSLTLSFTCLRKYYYTNILGIRSKKQSVHLWFGGLYAKALEEFYKFRANGATIDEALHRVVKDTLVASWDFEAGTPPAFDDPGAKTRMNLIRTIVWYVDQYADESDDGIRTYHLENGKPAVELSFTFDVDGEFLLCGHLDRVVLFGEQNKYIMDQKTSKSTIGPYYFSNFDLDNQMSMYSLAGEHVLDTPIKGVIIDAAQIAVGFSRFERGITTRSKDQLTEWLETAKFQISFTQQIAAKATEEQHWPMNLTACGNYGGCEFKGLCCKSPAVRNNYIKSDFRAHRWDPLKAR